MITGKTKVRRNEKVLSGGIDKEMVLLDLDENNYMVINKVASRIWELIEFQTSVDDLCQILQDEYEVDSVTCKKESIEFIEMLDKKGMIIFNE